MTTTYIIKKTSVITMITEVFLQIYVIHLLSVDFLYAML